MESKWLNIINNVIIVTGGSSGIGAAIIEELLSNGANVINMDINEGRKVHDKLLFIKTDIKDAVNIKQSVALVVEKFKRIDALINNAGINIPCLLVDDAHKYEIDETTFNLVTDINQRGLYLISQQVAKVMIKQQEGVIINMSSECGLEGSEGQSVYAATKAAVNGFTRSWAKELGKYNIRVIGVAPGIMEETGLRTLAYEESLSYTRNKSVEQLRAGYSNSSSIPLQRSGKLSEVADFVTYLVSQRASYITGVTLNVAGGKTRG